MFIGTSLLMFMIIFSLRMNHQEAARAANGADGNAVRAARACVRQKLTTQAQKPRRLQRRAWQPVLESLSRAIQVWLTELRYQPPALMLIGYAIHPAGLSALRDALGQIAGFTPGPEGELRQDSQGRWMFTLHLKSEG
jgi:pilus assembly protein HofN